VRKSGYGGGIQSVRNVAGESKAERKRGAGKNGCRVEEVNRDEAVKQEAAEKEKPKAREPKDFAEVRRNIATEVRLASGEIVKGLIAGAKDGQVGAAKYLFEVVGVYPATEETLERPEDSLVYSLYKRLVKTEPVAGEGDQSAEALTEPREIENAEAGGIEEKMPRSEIKAKWGQSEVRVLGGEGPGREDAVE